jgi:PKD repeat protein
MNLRELFRNKLENAEVSPSSSVNSQLMRKLARKEFLRFNPARLNIHYIGGILVAGITASLLFSPANIRKTGSTSVNNPITISKNISSVNTPVTAGPELKKPDSPETISSGSVINKVIDHSKSIVVKEPVTVTASRENNSVAQTDISKSYTGDGLFTDPLSEKNKLQGGIKTESILFETSSENGCPPLKVRFYNKSHSFDSCQWTFGDGGYSNEKNPEWIFDVEGEYKVVLNIFGTGGLKASYSSLITVYPKPQARFEIVPEKAVLPDDEIRFYNYSANAIKSRWDFGDGIKSDLFEPRHRYEKYGKYNVQLVVASDYGCTDSLVVKNAFSGSAYFIDFPNAFIPNAQGPTGGYYSSKSDEAAQVFHPVFSGVTNYQLKIFSKLGILIFESSDINIGWDGYIKGQLADPGVYIWKVRGSFRNGEPFTKMADVTLLKN